ncbi:MAG: hypothetical protein NTY50_01110 [Methylobacter sp.]|nr:hypothetical protein [Methylobacter sp.]
MSTKKPETPHHILPRIIRIKDAPFYLGMDKNRFNTEVRPSLTEMKIGTQGIAFDRIELDAWADDYMLRIGTSNKQKQEQKTWQRKSPASSKGTTVGTSTKSSAADAFAKALAQATSKKPKGI